MMHSADCRVQTGRARQGAVYVTDNLGDEHLARSQAVFGVYLRQGNARPCTRRRYRYSCPLFFTASTAALRSRTLIRSVRLHGTSS